MIVKQRINYSIVYDKEISFYKEDLARLNERCHTMIKEGEDDRFVITMRDVKKCIRKEDWVSPIDNKLIIPLNLIVKRFLDSKFDYESDIVTEVTHSRLSESPMIIEEDDD